MTGQTTTSRAVELQPEEARLCDRIKGALKASRELLDRDGGAETRHRIAEMGADAHRLHMLLLQRDPALEPRHHKYMVKNRGMSPRAPDFYAHIHPVEDLIRFLEDRDANQDPEDQTLGAEFQFRAYSNRWKREDIYRVTRTVTGWVVEHAAIGGPCDKSGSPYLFENLRQDGISYPSGLGGYMSELWEAASEDGCGLTQEQVQAGLNRLAAWVATTERAEPVDLIDSISGGTSQ